MAAVIPSEKAHEPYEPAGSKHYESRNASATRPAKLLVFILLDDNGEVLTPLPK